MGVQRFAPQMSTSTFYEPRRSSNADLNLYGAYEDTSLNGDRLNY